uniref:Uncharacterized protein n=1 Tax=Anguilla anguilla TaxID=7936 RepID=A0A0E9SN91_ANGAN
MLLYSDEFGRNLDGDTIKYTVSLSYWRKHDHSEARDNLRKHGPKKT